MSTFSTLITATIPALISFVASYLTFSINASRDRRESMAERAARKLLRHRGYTDRSFKAISASMGGWDNDPEELRKILVRAGAVRIHRKNSNGEKEEYWYLLSRERERIENMS